MKKNDINILETHPFTTFKSIMTLRLILLIYLSFGSVYKIFSQELSEEEIINGLYLETIDFISIGHVDQRNNLNSPYVVNHP